MTAIAIERNETGYWNIPDDHKQHVKAVWCVYMYDDNERTYMCELTPSVCCDFLYVYVEWIGEPDEETRDRISSFYESSDNEPLFIHAHNAEAIGPEHRKDLGTWPIDEDVFHDENATDEQLRKARIDAFDAAREYAQGNCPFLQDWENSDFRGLGFRAQSSAVKPTV